MINALSYVVVQTPHLDAWIAQARHHVGLHVDVVEPGVCVRLRADEKVQRLLVSACEGEASMGMGFGVLDAAALENTRQALEDAGYPTTAGTAEELRLRGWRAWCISPMRTVCAWKWPMASPMPRLRLYRGVLWGLPHGRYGPGACCADHRALR